LTFYEKIWLQVHLSTYSKRKVNNYFVTVYLYNSETASCVQQSKHSVLTLHNNNEMSDLKAV